MGGTQDALFVGPRRRLASCPAGPPCGGRHMANYSGAARVHAIRYRVLTRFVYFCKKALLFLLITNMPPTNKVTEKELQIGTYM